jgi:hypothetical protein
MQTIRYEEISRKASIGRKHRRGHIDILHTLLRPAKILDHPIRRFHLRPLAPPQLGRLDGHHVNPSIG